MSTRNAIAGAVVAALTAAAANPASGLTKSDVQPVADKVIGQVVPIVEHVANQEPWYQSRVTWGAIVAVGAGLAGLAGYTLDAEDQAGLVNAVVGAAAVIGGLITWYGRWRAKKPIGR